jgi:aminomethyltransferase
MTTRPAPEAGLGDLLLIVNAARKAEDLQHLQRHLEGRCRIEPLRDRALLALQGPQAVRVLARLQPGVERLLFMSGGAFELDGTPCFVTRSGYTGEDGFEISVPAERAEALARRLLREPEVGPAGLGARDTLRLEAGLCLYGHDIDVSTTPIEAGLGWAIPKARRPGGPRADSYPGAATIEAQMVRGAPRRRVGLLGVERVPVREGAELVDAHAHPIGRVTSGTIGPSLNQAIAMGYVAAPHAAHGHEVFAVVRGRSVPMRVTPLPFRTPRYVRG